MHIGTHLGSVNDGVHQSGKRTGRAAEVKTFPFAVKILPNPPIPVSLCPGGEVVPQFFTVNSFDAGQSAITEQLKE
jgi:hypothetical protein